MIKRIDEGISSQTAPRKATPASAPSPDETADDTAGWSIKDILGSAFTRSRPEDSTGRALNINWAAHARSQIGDMGTQVLTDLSRRPVRKIDTPPSHWLDGEIWLRG